MNANAMRIISAARYAVARKAPYFSTALNRVQQREAAAVPTMAMSARGTMYYNPDFTESLTVPQCAAVLCHELLHLIRNHAGRAERMGLPMQPRVRAVWNIAADMEINDDLKAGGWELPTGAVQCWDFSWDAGRTAEYYYRKLVEAAEQQQQQQQGGEGEGQGAEGSGSGQDGEGGDQANDGQGNTDGQWQQGPGYGECGGAAGNPHPCEQQDYAEGDEPIGMSPAELEATRNETAKDVQRYKARGRVPAGIARWAEDQLKPPKVSWQEKLQRLAQRAVTFRSGPVDYSYARPSRRQASIGYGMHRPILPSMRRPEVPVAFVLDTSGSMSGADILASLSEAKGILQATAGEIDFCACDAEVHSLRKVRTVAEARTLIKGGGGTSFIPAFRELERRNPRPKLVVYATDGHGSAPSQPPVGMDVIWLLVGSYRTTPASWGEVVEIEAES